METINFNLKANEFTFGSQLNEELKKINGNFLEAFLEFLNNKYNEINGYPVAGMAEDVVYYDIDSTGIHAVVSVDSYFYGIGGYRGDGTNNIWRINPSTREVIQRVSTNQNIYSDILYLDGWLYSCGGDGLAKINLSTLEDTLIYSTANFGATGGMCTDGTYIYCGGFSNKNLYKLSKTGVLVDTLTISEVDNIHACEYDSVNNVILATSSINNVIAKIDVDTFSVTDTFECIYSYLSDDHVCVDGYLWASIEGQGTHVLKLNISDFTDFEYIETGHASYCLVHKDGYIYNGNNLESSLTKIKISDNSVVKYYLGDQDNASPNEICFNGDYMLNTRWQYRGLYIRKNLTTENKLPLLDWRAGLGKFKNIEVVDLRANNLKIGDEAVTAKFLSPSNSLVLYDSVTELYYLFFDFDNNIIKFNYTDDISLLLQIGGLQEFADNEAAVSAGLPQTTLYHTGGVLKVVV